MTKTDYAALRERIDSFLRAFDLCPKNETNMKWVGKDATQHAADLSALLHRADLAEEMAGALEPFAHEFDSGNEALIDFRKASAALAKYREERG